MRSCALAVCALAMATMLHAQTPAAKNTGAVYGRVVDGSGDGAVAGSMVSLAAYSPAPETTPNPGRTVMTTADGYFVFRDVAPGRYSIAAAAFGFAPTGYPPQIVEVPDGDRPVNVSVRLLKLGSISGTVVDERGEPVAGVPVSALRRSTVGGSLVLRHEATSAATDDRGMFRIAQLPPDHYIIGALSTSIALPAGLAAQVETLRASGRIVTELLQSGISPKSGEGFRAGETVLTQVGPASPLAPDGRPLVYTNTLAPGTTNAAEAAVIPLGAGESRDGVNVAIRLSPAVRVSGVVTAPTPTVANIGVKLVPANGAEKIDAYTEDLNPAGVAVAVTDANGVFTFPAVAAGQYTLKSELSVIEPTPTQPAISLWSSQPLTVGDKAIDGLTVALRSGLRISGRVAFVGGESPIASGTPVGILLRPASLAGIWRTVPTRIASGDTFTSVGDPPGRYFVSTFQTPGWTLESVARGGRVVTDDVLDLEDDDIRDLVVTFSRQTTSVTGTIVDATGAADATARVIVFPADTNWWREGIVNNRRVREARATSAGGFEIIGLPPGEYYIAAIGSRVTGRPADPQFLERLVPGATTFTLDRAASRTLALKTFTPQGQ
jgi:hypothetical protein